MEAVITNRVNEQDFVEIIAESMGFAPSPIKPNWAKVIFPVGQGDSYYSRKVKNRGYYERPLSPNMREVHFSLTKLTNRQLAENGVTPHIREWCNECGHDVVALHPNCINVIKVREGLFLLRSGDAINDFVTATSEESIRETMDNTIKLLHGYAHQWTKWSKEAVIKQVEGLDVYKMPNGLSVRFDLNEHTFCQTAWQGEYIEHHNPLAFYWWLKKFF